MKLDNQVFISYAWDNRREAEIIDNDFFEFGVVLIRDIRDLNYKESIKKYMQRIRETDYALLLISDAFLKSPNCMYEAMELLKLPDFENRILPIVLKCANLYTPNQRSSYLKYWEHKIASLEEELREQKSIGFSNSIIEDLNKYKKIRDSIDELLKYLNEHLHYSFKVLLLNNYLPIKEQLGVSDSDSIFDKMSPREIKAYLNGQVVERKRIGRDLHDNIGTMASLLKLYMNVEEIKSEEKNEKMIKAQKLLNDLCMEIRRISHEYSSFEFMKFGLIASIQDITDIINSSNSRIKASFNSSGTESQISVQVEITIYRIIQELIGNILKHSKATECSVSLNYLKDHLNIIIQDNGIGFDSSNIQKSYRRGLQNVKNRVYSLHGNIVINTDDYSGTKINIEIPNNRLKIKN